MPAWLAFDAGSPVTSAAVADAGVLLAESSGASRSGPSLLQQMDDCLRRAGVAPRDLAGVVVLSGPGSFTGIRVALATALGLRAALGLPVYALSNLAALALHAGPQDGRPLVALVDALRDEWFAQSFSHDGRQWTAPDMPERRPAAALAPPAGAVLAAHLSQTLPDHLAGLPVRRAEALAAAVATAASTAGIQGLLTEELDPLYLRGFTPRSPQA